VGDLETLEKLLRARSVAHGDFVLSSGQRSSYYIDARKTTMSAEGLRLIGQVGLATIRAQRWEAQAVGGLTLGADPVAYAIARASADDPPILDGFSVRKNVKQHGTKHQIEGNFTPGARVVVVEDVITSGGSALEAARAVAAQGGIVVGILAVVDREQGGSDTIRQAGFQVVSLTTSSKLLSQA
jgi:orotate phosphoribosyltransferase